MTTKIHMLLQEVIINRKSILLCKTTNITPNFYFLPGGYIEHRENARELKEEIGQDYSFNINRF